MTGRVVLVLVLLCVAGLVMAARNPAFDASHNGGFYHAEKEIAPAANGAKPHIVFFLVDDFGWANAGFHRDSTDPEVQTPNMDALVKDGILLSRHYVYKYCSPTRSAIQSGRNPIHVNNLNLDPAVHNPKDPVSGFAGIPRNMTGIATKMAAGGYRTHMHGKYDAGMATMDHTPHGRGYETSLTYFKHANDYWTQRDGFCKIGKEPIVDLWLRNSSFEGPAHGFNSTCNGPVNITGEMCKGGPLSPHLYHGYEDALFGNMSLKRLQEHDPSEPLFLFHAFHIVHAPLEVPSVFFDKFSFIESTDKPGHERQTYHAMVNFADTIIGEVVALLKQKGMYDNTLIVLSADNGGPVYANGTAGANNFPLKGGKMSNWEGGVRVNAFASGGFIPESVRGTEYQGLVTGWDWYSTFSHLAGIDPTDHRAAAANLPPIDSHNMVDVLTGVNMTSPRTFIPLGTEPRTTKKYKTTTVNGFIKGDYKILIGTMFESGWQGPHYPNSTTDTTCFNTNLQSSCVQLCEPACLYNIVADPHELNDIAKEMPAKVNELLADLDVAVKNSFNPDRGLEDPAACKIATGEYRGFYGPFVFP